MRNSWLNSSMSVGCGPSTITCSGSGSALKIFCPSLLLVLPRKAVIDDKVAPARL